MARLVMKFGGTSVGDIDRIRNVAAHVAREVEAGHEVAVVVSAMSGETNRLVGLTRDIARLHDAREYDVVVSAGEQVSVGLLAMALQDLGIAARSWLGWQIAMKTSDVHGAARIRDIDVTAMEEQFKQGRVAVIAGFQGVSNNGRITTLGRGGSDTSAVAVAAALNAARCDIYTDVDGVYTTDPRMVPAAQKMHRISYEEMLEMASLGAKVMQPVSIQDARLNRINIEVKSSFKKKPGTLITKRKNIINNKIIAGISSTQNDAKVTLVGVKDKPGVAAMIFKPLSKNLINVDMVVQNISANR
ncbi:MAG: aspartate kinase, partial [Rhodobiaceae bacterium]|nr:aspartate kinase [Rhodobiaceae bacterium]